MDIYDEMNLVHQPCAERVYQGLAGEREQQDNNLIKPVILVDIWAIKQIATTTS
jgi:hypothetical protein